MGRGSRWESKYVVRSFVSFQKTKKVMAGVVVVVVVVVVAVAVAAVEVVHPQAWVELN